MPRLFISHSSQNDDWAIALHDWLIREGWSGDEDIFLDLDPDRGIAAGQRWAQALEEAATRCEAVLFIVSEAWLASKWCGDEYQLANKFNKKLFALLVEDVSLDRLPGGLAAQWQVVKLTGEPAERFLTVHPRTQRPSPVYISEAGLKSLERGLQKAGIGADTFELQPDAHGPFGWREPYRGLEPLEPEDAAVFFGRGADIVRGMDALRGLMVRKPPRLLVILGASGAGKSSFLRAGLWPRLARDDTQWVPLWAIRIGRGGAIEGAEGLLSALEELHRRFGKMVSRADLRQRLATPESFVELLRELRAAAARRALLTQPPGPLPIICLDQAEELFAADAGTDGEQLLRLVRAAMEANEALVLVTIRSDAYGLMQSAKSLAGVDQVPISLGPVPSGEMARVIREPSEVLRRKAGPAAPTFDAAAIERLQAEIEGEPDALPLLAFVLQRLMREHAAAGTIGTAQLDLSGGVTAAIESEAEAALADAGIVGDRAVQRQILRRLFIPRLARIDRDSKAPQRRVARRDELPADLLPLSRALTQRRLLVLKAVPRGRDGSEGEEATLEVAHEALLRRWPTLAELLAADRDALLLLDGVLQSAAEWEKADVERRPDYLLHRGSRLTDAQALKSRGTDWERELVPAAAYLAACQERDDSERAEKEAALAREHERLAEIATAQARTAYLQRRARWALAAIAAVVAASTGLVYWLYLTTIDLQKSLKTREQANLALQSSLDKRQLELNRAQTKLLAGLAAAERLRSNWDTALRLAVHGTRLDQRLDKGTVTPSAARAELAAALFQTQWYLILAGHKNQVTSAHFSPDGARVVTTSSDRTARIFDAATGKTILTLSGHGGVVMSAAFSPDGSRIVTGSLDKTARIWDAASGNVIAVLSGHTAGVWPVAFSTDGSRVVTGSYDKTARIWDATTGKEITVLSGHTDTLRSACFSPDGTRVITSSEDDSARVWDAATAKQLVSLQERLSISSARFSPDGKRIVTGSADKTVRILEADTGKEILALRGHDAAVMAASFSADGSLVVSGSFDRTARVWNAATGKEIVVLRGHEGRLMAAEFGPGGRGIVTGSLDDRTARLWEGDAVHKLILALRGHTRTVPSVRFSADGSRILTASDDGGRVWDAVTGKEIIALRGDSQGLWSAALSPDGKRIATGSTDHAVRLWDAATGNQIAVLRTLGGTVFSVAFSPDGSRIVAGTGDNLAQVFDAATGNEFVVLRGHSGEVHSAVFSPDGSRIATGSADQTIRIWDAATGKETRVLSSHADAVWSVAFSPDGTTLVSGSRDKTARLWDLATGKETAVLVGHDDQILSVGFSPDGKLVVTGSADTTARIWDVATTKEVAVLRGHPDRVWSVAFSPDGSRVATGSGDGPVGIWDTSLLMLSTAQVLAEVCERRLASLTTLSRGEMRLAGYADSVPEIDVCAEEK